MLAHIELQSINKRVVEAIELLGPFLYSLYFSRQLIVASDHLDLTLTELSERLIS